MDKEWFEQYEFEKGLREYSNKNTEKFKEIFDFIITENKNAFEAGYTIGKENGYDNGYYRARVDIIVALISTTEMTSEEVYKIVGLNDTNWIQYINNIRENYENGKKEGHEKGKKKSLDVVREQIELVKDDESKQEKLAELKSLMDELQNELDGKKDDQK